MTDLDRRLRLAENDVDRLTGDMRKVVEQVTTVATRTDTIAEALVSVTAAVEELTKRERAVPEPVYSWVRSTDPDVAVRELAELESWLVRVYLRYPGGVALAECWRRHDWVVEELLVLRDAYQVAWAPGASPSLRLDWHRRHRPAVAEAINTELQSCGLKRHVVANLADFQPARLVGIDDPTEVARWWVASHGQSPEPQPTRDMLAESEARRAAEIQRARSY